MTVPAIVALVMFVPVSVFLVNDPWVVEWNESLFLEINQYFTMGTMPLVMFGVSEFCSIIVPVGIGAVMG